MATSVKFDWTATIEVDGALVFQNDVQVYASVCGDGEVIIDSVGMWHRDAPGAAPRLVGMTYNADHHMAAFGSWAIKALMADDEFIEKAQAAAGLVYVGMGGNDPDGHFRRVA